MALGINRKLLWHLARYSEKIEKMKYFNLRTVDQILMKFDVWQYIASQSCYFKSRSDLVVLGGGGVGSGKPEILENT